MSDLPKRFYTTAAVAAQDAGFTVELDGRPLRTPAKAPLALPGREMAEVIAQEWTAQGDRIDPATMPATRSANSAIDKVAPQRDEVADMIAGYGGTDLLCYRAAAPEELVAEQAVAWDPLLDWAAERFDARLSVTSGVMPVTQSAEARTALAAQVADLEPFSLAALYDLVALSGSLVLGLAVTQGRLTPQEAWTLSRLDEDWQAREWGYDPEAQQEAEIKRQSFHAAARFWELAAGVHKP